MGFIKTKAIWQSKTVWAGIITIGASLAGLAGIEVPKQELSETIMTYLTDHNMAALIAGILTILGRVVADSKLTIAKG